MNPECYQCKVLAKAKDQLSEELRADVVNRESCRNMVMWCDDQRPPIKVMLEEREYAYGVI